MPCPVCSYPNGKTYTVREMMLGLRDAFQYQQCDKCSCLFLLNIPQNMSRYYPKDYYSFQATDRRMVRRLRNNLYLSWLSFAVNWRSVPEFDILRRLNFQRRWKILDVGCGSGRFVGDLRELGIQAQGVDPYIESPVMDSFGERVRKASLGDIHGQYDMILFSHSLEHIPNQLATLRQARARLTPGGTCVVMIPILGYAWEYFGTNWVQLDAPRHLTLHTVDSFLRLAHGARFSVLDVIYDSDEFQFWGSRAYQKNIPLCDATPPRGDQLKFMRNAAKELNLKQCGDRAQFYLQASTTN